MKHILLYFLHMGLLTAASFLPSSPAWERSVVINEIGAYEKKDYEWIEVFNASDKEIDMKGWSFWEQGVNHGLILAQGESFVVGAGEYAVIVQNFERFKELYPNVTNTVFDSSWASLSEEGEEIGLKNSEGSLLEHFTYVKAEYGSLERVNAFVDTYSEDNWKEYLDQESPKSNSAGSANYWTAQGISTDGMIEYSTSTDSSKDFLEEEIEDSNASLSVEKTGIEFLGVNQIETDGIHQEDFIVKNDSPVFSQLSEEWYRPLVAIMELSTTSTYIDNEVVFDASKSYGKDGDKLQYYWDFGDASFSSSSIVSHQYFATGTYVIELSLGNGHTSSTASTSVQVVDFGPDQIGTGGFYSDELTAEEKKSKMSASSSSRIGEDNSASLLDPRKYIFINEFVSYPDNGKPEWIELYNASSSSLRISGWRLRDGKGQIAVVSSAMESGSYLLVELEKNVLNNNGDLIRLEDEKAMLVDHVAYGEWNYETGLAPTPAPPRAYSSGRFGDYAGTEYKRNAFTVTSLPTPQAENQMSKKEAEKTELRHETARESGNGRSEASQGSGSKESSRIISRDIVTKGQTFVSTTTAIYKKGDIIINEIFPNPKGSDSDDEFIELLNLSDKVIDLSGWKLGDGSLRRYAIDSIVLEQGEYKIFKRKETHISLNNTGSEDALLFGPGGDLLDQVSYVGSYEGQSYMRSDEGAWFWTEEPSPGVRNILILKDTEEAVSSTASSTVGLKIEKRSLEENFPSFAPDDFAFIEISEIFPNPRGVDDGEFIEIYNRGSGAIDLAGLKLDDEEGGSRPYEFPIDTVIPPYSFRVFYKEETGLILNNSSDSVRLLFPNGEVLSEIFFTDVIENASFSRTSNDTWLWVAKATPGAPNELVLETGFLSGPGVRANLRSVASKTFVETGLNDLNNYESGDRLKVKGTVAVAPGVFGSQYFYMVEAEQSDSASSSFRGVQVYMNKKNFPQLITGDYIQVAGELSEARGEPRLKISAKEDIVKIDHAGLSLPEPAEISEIRTEQVGGLVRVAGEITSLKSTHMFVDDGTGEIKVYFKKGTGVHGGNFQEGHKVSVAGLLAKTDDSLQILPRSPGDIEMLESMSETSTDKEATPFVIKNNKIAYMFVMLFIVVILCGTVYVRKVKNKEEQIKT